MGPLLSRARVAGEVVLLAAVAALWWQHSRVRPAPVGVQVAARPNPAVVSAPVVPVKPKVVYVYVPAAKKKLALPAEVQASPSTYVLGSTKLSESDRPQTVTTTINTRTGRSETFVQQDPYPWLAAENRRSVSLSYGLKGYSMLHGGGTAWVYRATVRDDLVQAKALHLGVQLSADSDASYYAGVSLTYKF